MFYLKIQLISVLENEGKRVPEFLNIRLGLACKSLVSTLVGGTKFMEMRIQ